MAVVEIDINSDEYQIYYYRSWYRSFTKFPLPVFLEAQHKISKILIKYFEESNRNKRQKQSYYYVTERWRGIKIALMNQLEKVKSYL